jgi:hypothetical protein
MSFSVPANSVDNSYSYGSTFVAKNKTKAKAKAVAQKEVRAQNIEPIQEEEAEVRGRLEEEAKLILERKKQEELKKSQKNLFSLAFKVDLTVPTSQIDTTYALHLEMRYYVIKNLSIGLDLGYYPMSGEGQNLDSQIGLYDYSWNINSIPLYLGVNYSIPVFKNILIEAQGGFSAVFAFSKGETFNGSNEVSDVAYGYYLGAGVILKLGSAGDVIGELRYTGMYLDFNYPEFNEKLGDMGGKSILVGYRYIF